jgi:hypothetical protein
MSMVSILDAMALEIGALLEVNMHVTAGNMDHAVVDNHS